MSIEYITIAFRTALPPPMKLTLIALADCAGHDGKCFPSAAYLADKTGMHRSTILEHLKKFREMGWLEPTGERVGRSNQIPVYRLILPVPQDDQSLEATGTSRVGRPVPVVQDDPEPSGEPSQELSERGTTSATVPKVIKLYHEKLPTLPRVAKLTTARAQTIKARIREDLHEMTQWENFFDHVANSDFLMGRVDGTMGRPPFRADLEWLTKASHFTHIAEGKYHRE